MKSRQGFVSNSSTSSFCIYGQTLPSNIEVNIEYMRAFKKDHPERFSSFIETQRKSYSSSGSDWAVKIIEALAILENVDDESMFVEKKNRNCDCPEWQDNMAFCPGCGKSSYSKPTNPNKEKLEEYLNEAPSELISKITGLEVRYYYDDYVIGRSLTKIRDEETGASFKKGVEDALTELGITPSCSMMQEAWQDG